MSGAGEGGRTGGAIATAGLMAAVWLAVNAVWGTTGGGDTLVSRWERTLMPLGGWVALGLAAAGAGALVAARRGDRGMLLVSCMLLAYLAGVLGGRHARLALAPSGPVLDRSFLAVPAIPMLAVAWLFRVGGPAYPLRFGRWGAGTSPGWARRLAWALLLLALPVALLLHASVGFAPIVTGRIWDTLPTVLALALVNALVEELLFRGLIMPPLVHRLGSTRGLWLQATFFGVHHWGASPAPIAGLPIAALLVILAVLLGRSVVETRGLGWAICLHAALDIAFLTTHVGAE